LQHTCFCQAQTFPVLEASKIEVMASCPEASWKRTLMSFGQRHEVFWFSDFAAKSCAIHQVVRFGAFSPEGMKNSHLVSSFSTLDLQSGIRKCYRMQPFHSAQHRSPAVGWVAPSLTRQRLAGCFVGATLHRPRLQGSKAKICFKKTKKQSFSPRLGRSSSLLSASSGIAVLKPATKSPEVEGRLS